jgi:hypothetical protein
MILVTLPGANKYDRVPHVALAPQALRLLQTILFGGMVAMIRGGRIALNPQIIFKWADGPVTYVCITQVQRFVHLENMAKDVETQESHRHHLAHRYTLLTWDFFWKPFRS